MGVLFNDCIYCGKPMEADHDGWSHNVCDQVVRADWAACEVIDNGRLSKIEKRLRKAGRCSWQIRAPGWDGPGTYCGREVAGSGDYCLEHDCEAAGDDEGAAQERWERTEQLLANAAARGEI